MNPRCIESNKDNNLTFLPNVNGLIKIADIKKTTEVVSFILYHVRESNP